MIPSGLLIGEDVNGRQPVTVNVLRELPTQIGVFGVSSVARLLAFRALAFGARLTVLTPAPTTWAALRTVAAGPPWVLIAPPNTRVPHSGSAIAPSMIVDDTGVTPPGLRRDVGPWQTVLTVCARLTAQSLADLRLFDLLAIGRLSGQDARLLCAAGSLSQQAVRWLVELPTDVVALAIAGRLTFVRLAPTPTEQAVL
jgi:hypothetical protein